MPRQSPKGPAEATAASLLRLYGEILRQLERGFVVLHVEDPADLGSFRLIDYTPAAERLTGVRLDRYLGQTIGEGSSEVLRADRLQRYAEVLRTGVRQDVGEVRSIHPEDSSDRVVSVTALPLSGGCVALMFEDVTARGENEQVRRSEDLMLRAERLARMGSWHWEVASDTVIWSQELYDIHGLEPMTSLTLERALEPVLPQDRDRVRRTLHSVVHDPAPFRFDERIVRTDGEVRVLDSQGDVTVGTDGKARALFGFSRDVTEERHAQVALAEREKRFATLFHASPVAISVSTLAEGRLLDVNERWCDLTGYSRDEAVGHLKEELLLWAHPEQRKKLVAQLRAYGSVRETEFLFRTRSGLLRRVLAAVERIEIEGQDCVLMLLLRT